MGIQEKGPNGNCCVHHVQPAAEQPCFIPNKTTATPRRISGTPFGVLPSTRKSCFTIKAIQSEKPTYEVMQPLNGDPFIGSLETPVTSSPLIAWSPSDLPGYRTVGNPLLRGVKVGLAHRYLVVGPFVIRGPLRNTDIAGPAGCLAAAGLVVILSICLAIYGISSFKEGEPSTAPSLTLTGRKKKPDQLQTAEGWAKFTGGFFVGGISDLQVSPQITHTPDKADRLNIRHPQISS